MVRVARPVSASSEGSIPPEDLLAALSQPSFYPHSPESVELRETHISWVFLAGSHVYKVKKPIRLPFLDYSTLELRRSLCLEEVRLNRRLAPAVYLGVRSVVRRDGRLELGELDDRHAVEYAVEMRRFPEERTLARLLDRGEATPAELEAVGVRLGRFHRSVERPDLLPADALRAFGQIVDENFQTLLDVSADAIGRDDVVAAQRFSATFLAATRDRLLDRVQGGHWREGHGDLRAEHVILDEGIDVVDCVEFDPALRRIDASFDLAFLVMEVEALGTRELADALVAGYRAAGGDPGDRALLSFYAAQRAWIRSKVTLVRAGQLEAGERRQSATAEGARLFSLGRRMAWRARLPLALVVCGAPASGKSHLARALSETSGLPHLNSDVVRKRLAGLDATERAGREHYAESFTARTYRELARLAAEELRRTGGAIVDATYRRAAARRALVDALARSRARVVFVECRAPLALLAERARRRAASAASVSDADAEVAERLRREFEPLDEVEPGSHLVIRTDLPTTTSIVELEARLDVSLFA